jgi:hypothetical protein
MYTAALDSSRDTVIPKARSLSGHAMMATPFHPVKQ